MLLGCFFRKKGEPTIIVFDEEVEAAAKASGIKMSEAGVRLHSSCKTSFN